MIDKAKNKQNQQKKPDVVTFVNLPYLKTGTYLHQ